MSDDLLNTEWDDLESELDATVARWRPEPGDRLLGDVIGITYTDGKHGTYATVRVRERSGDIAEVVASHTTLRNKLTELKVQAGDKLGVKYLGEVSKVDGNGSYFDYSVARRGDDPRRPGDVFDPDANSGDFDLGLLPDVE